jgi:hypothetical protein
MSIDTIWDAVAGIALAIAEKIPSVIRTGQTGHLADLFGRTSRSGLDGTQRIQR